MVEELIVYDGSEFLAGLGLGALGLGSGGGAFAAFLGFFVGHVVTKGLLVASGVPKEGDVLIWTSLIIDHKEYYTHITVRDGDLARIDAGVVPVTETRVKIKWLLPEGAAP